MIKRQRKKHSWCLCPLAAECDERCDSERERERVKDAEICQNQNEYARMELREENSSLLSTTSISSPTHPLCQRRTSQGDPSRGDQN